MVRVPARLPPTIAPPHTPTSRGQLHLIVEWWWLSVKALESSRVSIVRIFCANLHALPFTHERLNEVIMEYVRV